MTEALIVALGSRRYRVERPFGDWAAGQGMVSDVAVDRRGHIFVLLRRDPLCSPAAPAVFELAPDGSRIAAWGQEIADAHMLMVGPAGQIGVVDRDAHEVIIFHGNGQRIAGLGRRHHPGRPFNHPTDVAWMAGGKIVVSDGYGNGLLHVFTPAGEPLRSFGGIGVAPGSFLTPHALWPVGEHRILVADRENHRLQLFDLDGTAAGRVDRLLPAASHLG